MNYLLHPSAESDIRESAYHYRKRVNLALAQAFLSEFKNSVCLLLENPLLGAVWFHGKRRLVMKRFPIDLCY